MPQYGMPDAFGVLLQRLQAAFNEISEELRTEYSLGYYPSDSKQDGKFRHLKVEVTNKDYKVLAREGYYARKSEK